MNVATMMFAILLTSSLICTGAFAGPKHGRGGPPGLAKKGGVPPGLAKKSGLPPGIAKKYRVGQQLPRSSYRPIEPEYRARLPYASRHGSEWVRVGRDLYLLRKATGTIADVVHDWLR